MFWIAILIGSLALTHFGVFVGCLVTYSFSASVFFGSVKIGFGSRVDISALGRQREKRHLTGVPGGCVLV